MMSYSIVIVMNYFSDDLFYSNSNQPHQGRGNKE